MPNFDFILSTKLTRFTSISSSLDKLDFDETDAVLLRFLFNDTKEGFLFGGVSVCASLKFFVIF